MPDISPHWAMILQTFWRQHSFNDTSHIFFSKGDDWWTVITDRGKYTVNVCLNYQIDKAASQGMELLMIETRINIP